MKPQALAGRRDGELLLQKKSFSLLFKVQCGFTEAIVNGNMYILYLS